MLDDADRLHAAHSDDPPATGDVPDASSVRALRKAALFLWRYADTIETAPQTAAEHLPTSEARDDAHDHADHLRTNLDQVLAALTEAGEPAVGEPLYRARVDVADGRWRLRVYEPHGPASHVCDNCDGIDPASCLFNTGPLALAADLGPAGNAFAPAAFGRHLTEHGYLTGALHDLRLTTRLLKDSQLGVTARRLRVPPGAPAPVRSPPVPGRGSTLSAKGFA